MRLEKSSVMKPDGIRLSGTALIRVPAPNTRAELREVLGAPFERIPTLQFAPLTDPSLLTSGGGVFDSRRLPVTW